MKPGEPGRLTQTDLETLWTAVSKLESQVCRNPDLPPVYRDIVRDAFVVLRKYSPEPSPADSSREKSGVQKAIEAFAIAMGTAQRYKAEAEKLRQDVETLEKLYHWCPALEGHPEREQYEADLDAACEVIIRRSNTEPAAVPPVEDREWERRARQWLAAQGEIGWSSLKAAAFASHELQQHKKQAEIWYDEMSKCAKTEAAELQAAEKKIEELEKRLEASDLAANCGGWPIGRKCSSPKEPNHEIFGPHHGNGKGTFLCEFHWFQQQIEAAERERDEARAALQAVANLAANQQWDEVMKLFNEPLARSQPSAEGSE